MTFKPGMIFLAALILGMLGIGYWTQSEPAQASAVGAARKVPVKTEAAPVVAKKDSSAVLDVLEGLVSPEGAQVGGRRLTPEEHFRQVLARVAKERGLSPEDLEKAVRDWLDEEEGEDKMDHYQMALAWYRRGQFDKAVASAVLAYQEALSQSPPDVVLARKASLIQASAYMTMQRYEEALSAYDQAVATTDRRRETAAWVSVQESRAYALFQLERYPEMTRTLTEVVYARQQMAPVDNAAISYSLSFLGEAYRRQGMLQEAQSTLQQAVSRMNRTSQVSQTVRYETISTLAQILLDLGRVAEAEPLLQQAHRIMQQTGSGRGIDPGRTLIQLGQVALLQGQSADAEKWFRQGIAHYEKQGDPGQARRLGSQLAALSAALRQQGRLAEAEQASLQAIDVMKTAPEGFEYRLASAYNSLANVHLHSKDYAKAEPYLREALALDEARYGPDDIKVADDLSFLAASLVGQRRFVEAEPLITDSVSIQFYRAATTGQIPPNLAGSLRVYHTNLRAQGLSNAAALAQIQSLAREVRMPDSLLTPLLQAKALNP